MILTFIMIDGPAQRDLAELEAKLQPRALSELMAAPIAEHFRQRAEEDFASEGGRFGGWSPLSPKSREIRKWLAEQNGYRIGPAHPINVRSGEMRKWATSGTVQATPVPGGANFTYPGTAASGELAIKVETAQHGKGAPYTKPRPIFGITAPDAFIIEGMIIERVLN